MSRNLVGQAFQPARTGRLLMSHSIAYSPKTTRFLFIPVMLAAVFFRFYHLNGSPAGIVYDAAINGADAWRMWHRGGWAPFLFANGGREALFIALQSLSTAALGTPTAALRLPGVLADTLAVAALYGLARYLWRSHWLAFFAGLAAAASPWLLGISRLGFRAALVPLLATLLFWTFLLARRSKGRGFFVLSGALLGLSAYTYAAAKILPLILLAALLSDLFFSGDEGRGVWKSAAYRRGLALFIGAAGAVYLPLALYLRSFNSGDRVASVGVWNFTAGAAGLMRALAENALVSLGYLCCAGNSQLLIFGALNRPAFSLGLGSLVFVGLIVALKRSNRFEFRLLWLWLLLGLLPGILAIEAPHPLRLIVAAPAAMLLLALGARWLMNYANWLKWAVAFWIAAAGVFSFYTYYVQWATSDAVADLFNVETARRAEDLLAQTAAGRTLYLPQSSYADPVLRYYLLNLPPRAAGAFNETAQKVAFSPHFDEAEAVWVRLNSESAFVLPPFTDETRLTLEESGVSTTMDAPNLAWQKPKIALNYQFETVELKGAAFSSDIPAGGELNVTLFWEAAANPERDYQVMLQVLNDAQQVVSLNDLSLPAGGAYPTTYWRPEIDYVPDYHSLQLQENLAVGRYWLAVALYDPARAARLPLQQAQSKPISSISPNAPDTAFLGPLKVSPQPPLEDGFIIMQNNFSDAAALLGVKVNRQTLTAGDSLQVELLWQGAGQAKVDYTVFVHLLNAAGEVVSGHDGQPMNGAYPTTLWAAGEKVLDSHSLATDNLPPGAYSLEVGLYNLETGQRLPLTNGRQQATLPLEIAIVNRK